MYTPENTPNSKLYTLATCKLGVYVGRNPDDLRPEDILRTVSFYEVFSLYFSFVHKFTKGY